jgi:ribosomal protein S18 acetylase RimI-like enzyme
MLFRIESNADHVQDDEILRLLTEAYVHGGYTTPERAAQIFLPAAIRGRGELITACDGEGALVGMVIVVRPDAPARCMAEPCEAEIHLLAVATHCRRLGLGRQLMEKSLEVIGGMGFVRALLWTQPTMLPAHRLYESLGFERTPNRDRLLDGIPFLIYLKSLADCHSSEH